MSASKAQKRKNKKKYFQSSKKSKCSNIESGMRGFLMTCNDEHRCVKEAYNLLNEFADEMYGPEFEVLDKEHSDDIDIKDQLAKEISAMKSKRRFQQAFTKIKGIVFINTTIPEPVSLVNKVFDSVIKTGKQKTRFILRFTPVIITCKAYETDIRKALDDILLKYSSDEKNKELTYKVDCKIRHNDTITASHMIKYVRDSVESLSLNWTACILEPQVMVSFNVLRTVCCIGMLDKYEEYKKYNLFSVVSPVDGTTASCPVTVDDKVRTSECEKEDENGSDVISKNQAESCDE